MPRFVIGTNSYRTKGDAVTAVRAILNEAEIDKIIVGDRGVLIGQLFELHPHAGQKVQRGFIGHGVRINDYNGAKSRGFHVFHPGHGTTDWSYQPCFNSRLAEPSTSAAMRAAIMLSQASFRRAAFRGRLTYDCPSCRKQVEAKAVEVHHRAPNTFRALMARYIAAHGVPAVVPSPHFGDDFADAKTAASWIAFHDLHADRIVLCKACHLVKRHAEIEC